MLQNILELNGAQKLSKNELQSIQGGKCTGPDCLRPCNSQYDCPQCFTCSGDGGYCFPGNCD